MSSLMKLIGLFQLTTLDSIKGQGYIKIQQLKGFNYFIQVNKTKFESKGRSLMHYFNPQEGISAR